MSTVNDTFTGVQNLPGTLGEINLNTISASDDKLGFFGATPVVQPKVTQTLPATTANNAANIAAIYKALQDLGLFK